MSQVSRIKIDNFSLGSHPQRLTDDKTRINGLMASPSKFINNFQPSSTYSIPLYQQKPRIYSSNSCVTPTKRRIILRQHSTPLIPHRPCLRQCSTVQDSSSIPTHNMTVIPIHQKNMSSIWPENNKHTTHKNCDRTEFRRDVLFPIKRPAQLLPSIPLSVVGGFDATSLEPSNQQRTENPMYPKHPTNVISTVYTQMASEHYSPQNYPFKIALEIALPTQNSFPIPVELSRFNNQSSNELLRSCTSSLDFPKFELMPSEDHSHASKKNCDEVSSKSDMEREVSSSQPPQSCEIDEQSRSNSGIFLNCALSNGLESRSSTETQSYNLGNLSRTSSIVSASCCGSNGLPMSNLNVHDLMKKKNSLLQQIVMQYKNLLGLMHEEMDITGDMPDDYEESVDNYQIAMDIFHSSRLNGNFESYSLPKIGKSTPFKGSSYCLSPKFLRNLSSGSLQNIVQAQDEEKRKNPLSTDPQQSGRGNYRAKSTPRDLPLRLDDSQSRGKLNETLRPVSSNIRKWFSMKSVNGTQPSLAGLKNSETSKSTCKIPLPVSETYSVRPIDSIKLQDLIAWKEVEIATVKNILDANQERSIDKKQTQKSCKAYKLSMIQNTITLKQLQEELSDLKSKQHAADKCTRSKSVTRLPTTHCLGDELPPRITSVPVRVSDVQYRPLHLEISSNDKSKAEISSKKLSACQTSSEFNQESAENFESARTANGSSEPSIISANQKSPEFEMFLPSTSILPSPLHTLESSVETPKTLAQSTCDLHMSRGLLQTRSATPSIGSLENLSSSPLTTPTPSRSCRHHQSTIHQIPTSLSTSTMSDTIKRIDHRRTAIKSYGRPNYQSRGISSASGSQFAKSPMRGGSLTFTTSSTKTSPMNQSMNLLHRGEDERKSPQSSLSSWNLLSPQGVIMRNSAWHSPECFSIATQENFPESNLMQSSPMGTVTSMKQFTLIQPINELERLTSHVSTDVVDLGSKTRFTLADKLKMSTSSSFH